MNDLKDKFHSALGRYWDCAYAEGKEGRNHDTADGRAQESLGVLLDIVDSLFASRREALEEAAKECEAAAKRYAGGELSMDFKYCAAAIRALIDPPPPTGGQS